MLIVNIQRAAAVVVPAAHEQNRCSLFCAALAVFVSSLTHTRRDCAGRLFRGDECVLEPRSVCYCWGESSSSAAECASKTQCTDVEKTQNKDQHAQRPQHTHTAWVWSWFIFLGHHLAEWLDKFFPISEEAFEVAPVIGWMNLWICDFPCWQLMYLKLATKMWWNNLSSESHYDSLVLESFSAIWNDLNQQIEFTWFVVRTWTIKLCISLSTSRTFASKIQLDRTGPKKQQLTHNYKT